MHQPHLPRCSRPALCRALCVPWDQLPLVWAFQWAGRLFPRGLSLGLQLLSNILENIFVEETLILPSCPSKSRRASSAWAGEDEATCGRRACSCPHPDIEELFPKLLAIE